MNVHLEFVLCPFVVSCRGHWAVFFIFCKKIWQVPAVDEFQRQWYARKCLTKDINHRLKVCFFSVSVDIKTVCAISKRRTLFTCHRTNDIKELRPRRWEWAKPFSFLFPCHWIFIICLGCHEKKTERIGRAHCYSDIQMLTICWISFPWGWFSFFKYAFFHVFPIFLIDLLRPRKYILFACNVKSENYTVFFC